MVSCYSILKHRGNAVQNYSEDYKWALAINITMGWGKVSSQVYLWAKKPNDLMLFYLMGRDIQHSLRVLRIETFKLRGGESVHD
jgi:hypothetical protein